MRPQPRAAIAAGAAALALATTACVANTDTADAIKVDSSDDACTVAVAETPSGTISFSVTNSGSQITEFYLLASDGLRIVGEVENIGPGITRDLVVQAPPGDYFTACKPGMVGDGIRSPFTVTDSGEAVGQGGEAAQLLEQAEADYLAYVKDQAGALITGTEEFAAAYASRDDEAARELYAQVRVHWERIEPVAESFGDLDPLLDAREADLGEGERWSGWHLIEKDLWPPAEADNNGLTYVPLTPEQRIEAADDLVRLTQELVDRVNASDFSIEAFQISNGAKELLDEVATGKVTGEEEIWSHTDLWDFAANVDGARVALDVLRPVAEQRDPELVETLDAAFAELDATLATHGSLDAGFTTYDQLSPEQVTALAAAVDAVAEPLSKLTAVITGA